MIQTIAGAWLSASGIVPALAESEKKFSNDKKNDEYKSSLQIFMDGHVHISGAVYWNKIDPWNKEAPGVWNYAKARSSGVNCIIDNLSTYGYWAYNYTPKMMLRMIERFHKYAACHADRMGIALSVIDARRIVSSGRMAVFMGNESGWDMEGDLDVLGAMYRLGLRTTVFPPQVNYNTFCDSELAALTGQQPDLYHGIDDQARKMVEEMNRLGILIDVTHGTEAAKLQLISASGAPVVASHESFIAVSGAGMSDNVLNAIANKGGLVGIIGWAGAIGKRYRSWMKNNPARAQEAIKSFATLLNLDIKRDSGDHGEFINAMDESFRRNFSALYDWQEDEIGKTKIPTADEWAEHVLHAIKTVGADHVAIGLDMNDGRSGVPHDSSGYGSLRKALERITTSTNTKKIMGENWLTVFESVEQFNGRSIHSL